MVLALLAVNKNKNERCLPSSGACLEIPHRARSNERQVFPHTRGVL